MSSRWDSLFGRKRHYEILSPRSSGDSSPQTGASGLTGTRVSLEQLEQIYKSDAIAFSIINRYSNAIVGPGYTMHCEDSEQQELWNEWALSVRFKREIFRAVKNAWIYGNGYIELVRNKADDNIVKLKDVYPLTIDFQKSESGRIIYDPETKDPLGYMQKVELEKGLKKIKLRPEQIAHLKVLEFGEAHAGISPFEPLYKAVLCKLNIDEAMGESAFRQAFPIYVAYVGLPDRDPTAEELDETHKKIIQIGQRSVLTFPHYTKLERMDSPSVEAVAKYADYFLDIITAGTGLPRALLMPTPGVTYAALERLGMEWEKAVREYQDFLEEQIEDQIFQRVLEINDSLHELPRFRFKDISPSMKLSKSRRLATLARAGLLIWDKRLEAWLRELENLPEIEEETHLGRPMIPLQLEGEAGGEEGEDDSNLKEIVRQMLEEIKEEV